MELYLIRHAQSENNARPQEERVHDPGLTDVGIEQAKRLAEWIPSLRLTRLVTSPFLRTLLTAEHIRKSTKLTPFVRAELHELGGCVKGTHAHNMAGQPGLARSEIEESFPSFDVCSKITESGWWKSRPYETIADATDRASQLLSATQAEFGDSDERVAYVMHGDFKVIFLQLVDQRRFDTAWNVSVSKISLSCDSAELELYNQVNHLTPDLLTC